MWCIKCEADVAAEVTADNRQARCANCGTAIPTASASRSSDSASHARELLERWSQGPQLPGVETTDRSSEHTRTTRSHAAVSKQPAYRLDNAHPLPHQGSPQTQETPNEPAHQSVPQPQSVQQHAASVPHPASYPTAAPQEAAWSAPARMHDPHAIGERPPHFDVQTVGQPETKSNLQAFWGQMLAYGGVLALTIGAAMLLMGYFGSTEWQEYTPTGWLVTITGQMLLFLGVITLVSGGLEQTSQEVAKRIDYLGDRMIRIEWASQHALKGPSIPAEQFASDQSAEHQHQRQTAAVPRT